MNGFARRLVVAGVVAVPLALGAAAVGAPAALAHPLGNLSVNTYDGFLVTTDRIVVDHVEDLAEVPALQAVRAADTDGDDALDSAESRAWAGARCADAARRVTVHTGGSALPVSQAPGSAPRVRVSAGQAGLPLLRVECGLRTPLLDAWAGGRSAQVRLDVEPVSDLGWREVTLRADGVRLGDATVPQRSVSSRLTEFPEDLRSRQPDVRTASAVVTTGSSVAAALPAGASAGAQAGAPAGGPPADRNLLERLTDDVSGWLVTPGGWALALLVGGAAALGGAHAVAPGHGKTVIAAAVIAGRREESRRRRWTDALALGGAVTAAHTTSVLVLGAVLVLAGATLPGAVMACLAVLSGLIVVGLGIWLLRSSTSGHGHSHHGHDPHHDHDSHDDHHHHHEHHHHHDEHHGHAHPPLPTTGRAGRRLLAGLGLAGGLTPSPTALLLLLAAVSAGHAWAGVAAVLAFGVGMAAVLASVGVLVATGRCTLARFGGPARFPTLTRLLPRLAGLGVVGGGTLLLARGAAMAVGA